MTATIGCIAPAVNGAGCADRGVIDSRSGGRQRSRRRRRRPAARRLDRCGSRSGRSASDLLVAQPLQHFEHLAPGREHPPAALLVLVHRHHEFHLGFRVFPLACRRIDEPATAAELPRVGRPRRLLGRLAIGPLAGLTRGMIRGSICWTRPDGWLMLVTLLSSPAPEGTESPAGGPNLGECHPATIRHQRGSPPFRRNGDITESLEKSPSRNLNRGCDSSAWHI